MSERLNLIAHSGTRIIMDADDGMFLFRDQSVTDWQSLYSEEIDLEVEAPVRGGINLAEILRNPLILLDKITEAQAVEILSVFMDRFHWAGTVFTRVDAEDYVERPLTDPEWAAITDQDGWSEVDDRIYHTCYGFIDEVIPDEETEDWE